MPGRVSLGFTSAGAGPLVVAFAVVAGTIFLALAGRRKWRLAAARREEVMRLAVLAAEEAAAAEAESATLTYGALAGAEADQSPRCAVCYSPTTTRCSQCKAVRYCSGRCQIIHWRLGHKVECRPPQINGSNSKGVQAEQQGLCDEILEIERKQCQEPAETFFERPSSDSGFSSEVFSDDDICVPKSFMGTSGNESVSDSFTDSSSSSSSNFSDTPEKIDVPSRGEYLSLLQDARRAEPSSCNVFTENTRSAIDDNETTEVPSSEISNVTSSSNNISWVTNLEQKASKSRSEVVKCKPSDSFGTNLIKPDNLRNFEPSEECKRREDAVIDSNVAQSGEVFNTTVSESSEEDSCNQFDENSHLKMSSNVSDDNENLSHRAALLEGTALPDGRGFTALRFDKSGLISNGKSNGSWLQHLRSLNSLSSISSSDNKSSYGGWHSVPHDRSLKFHNASTPTVPAKAAENTVSMSNGITDLKSSVRRVVQQFKSSKMSKQHLSGSASDVWRKRRMLFPYDHFVKLYTCEKAELRPCGLINCGNSCYANAVLQCLAFTRPLTAYLLQGHHSRTCPKGEWCFTCEFECLLMKAKQGQSPLSPIGILSHIHNIGSHLGHGRQEDAHEFLRYAIDAMQSVCLKEAGPKVFGPVAEETTLIQLIFGGYLRSQIKCMRCRGKSERHERMMDLTVEIQGDIGTLEEALARFTASEVLDGENRYQCYRCKSYERAKKKLTVLDAPNILTIALKRFQTGKFGKLNKAVRFPEHLDLAPYMSETNDKSLIYKLYAVVVHLDVMNAAFSGHYVCYVKSTQGKWYKIDDSKVKPVELERILSKNAYMLLYARCSPHAPRLMRGPLVQDQDKSKKIGCKETVSSGHDGERPRPSPGMAHPGSSITHLRSQAYPYWTSYRPVNFDSSDLISDGFPFPRTDSSSDCSSLFSCSDEGSCSTESTRYSTSTDEYSEYIFGDADGSS